MAEKAFAAMTPCDILADLKSAEHDFLMGRTAKRVRYRSDTGSEQEIDHQRFDLGALQEAITRYEGLCNASKGITTGGRRVMQAGF